MNNSGLQKLYYSFKILALFIFTEFAFAQATNIGGVASKITATLENVTLLITAAAYVTGAGLFFVAIFQFRQHKENPTQTPLSKPMMFLGIAAALLFFPTLIKVTEGTIFGTGASTGGGAKGTLISG